MQNLPILTTANSITPAQASTLAANNTAPATEPFGSVLARQRSSSSEHNAGAKGKDQAASPAAPSTESAPAASDEPETPIPDVINILPGDILASLLPAATGTKSVAAKEKPAPQTPAPDGISTLPGDMLAALLSTPIAIHGASTATPQQHIAVEGKVGTRQQSIAAGIQDNAQQSANMNQSIGEQAASPLLRTQGNTTPAIAAANSTQDKTFTATLEALSKEAANTALPAAATQNSAPAQVALSDAVALAGLAQGTASPIASSTNAPAQAVVNTPVTHEAWGDEFNQKVTWLATQHEQTAELHLNPPHLGPLDVVLNISGDQATALFISPHAAVRDAVEQALPKLREMLADNGITLGNAMVNDQSAKEQQAGQASKQPVVNGSLPEKTDDTAPVGLVWPARRHQGMVDTFA